MNPDNDRYTVELHSFCDSSSEAYGHCVKSVRNRSCSGAYFPAFGITITSNTDFFYVAGVAIYMHEISVSKQFHITLYSAKY